MNIAIIDYQAGNVASVLYALERLGFKAELSSDPAKIEQADKVIFPGVGEASSAMKKLKETGLNLLIPKLQQPVLGICLGMQLLCASSEEGEVDCLGIFPEKVKRFRQVPKVPHMGWNKLTALKGQLYAKCQEDNVYFVHSYYVEPNSYSSATCEYYIPFSASLEKDNFYAVQYHPEKSGSYGEQVLKNFLAL